MKAMNVVGDRRGPLVSGTFDVIDVIHRRCQSTGSRSGTYVARR
jgi:hypothetical protein